LNILKIFFVYIKINKLYILSFFMNIIEYEGVRVPVGTHEGKVIIIGADHRGFEYKESLRERLLRRRYIVRDVGTHSPERCDYPLIAAEIARRVGEDRKFMSVGIGVCGTGIGMSLVANKIRGVYAAACLTPDKARISRRHNNADFLAIGADDVSLETAIEIVEDWLTTPFQAEGDDKAYLRRYVETVKIERGVS